MILDGDKRRDLVKRYLSTRYAEHILKFPYFGSKITEHQYIMANLPSAIRNSFLDPNLTSRGVAAYIRDHENDTMYTFVRGKKGTRR